MELTLTGAEELLAALRSLDEKASTKIMKKALRAGAKVIETHAQQDAPKRTGVMAAAFKIKVSQKKRNHRVTATVALNASAFKGKFYALFVNYGRHVGLRTLASLYRAKQSKQEQKFIPGTRWMNKSFEKSASQALSVISDVAKQELDSIKGEK